MVRFEMGAGKTWPLRAALLGFAAVTLAACAGGPRPTADTGGAPTAKFNGYKVGKPYEVKGVWYYPKDQPNYDEIGIASWYGEQFHNHYTADGEVFDMHVPSAAHKTLPLPSLVEVTNLANGRTLIVRVNDRGPFVDGRVIDLSREAATELGFMAMGVTKVRVRYVGRADAPPEPRQYQASNPQPSLPKPSFKPSAPPIELADTTITPPVAVPAAMPAARPAALPEAPPMTVAAEKPVSETPLAPLASAGQPSYVAAAPPAKASLAEVDKLLSDTPPAAAPAVPAAAGLQVQAGAFASRANAEALASRLAGAGQPDVEPFERNGQTLYRVVVRGLADPAAAAAARTQAASLGAPGARVIAGF